MCIGNFLEALTKKFLYSNRALIEKFFCQKLSKHEF